MAETSTITTVSLGSVDAIPVGQGRCYIVGGEQIAVLRQRDGRIFATQNRCPHRKGPLAEGLLGNNRIICPLHGRQFHLETGKGSEPTECVKIYSVQEVDGNLTLSLEDSVK